jgi:cell division protein FtsW (lipid II flippase)
MIDLVGSGLAMLGATLPWLLAAVVALGSIVLLWPMLRLLLPRMLPLGLTLAVIWLWGAALLHTAERQPPAYMITDILIEPQVRSIVLGRAELMQNPGLSGSAAEQHVQLVQDRGNWSIANVALQRHLRLEYVETATAKSVEFDSSLVPLHAGDELRLSRKGAEPWRVAFPAVTREHVTIEIRAGAEPQPSRSYEVHWSLWGADIRSASGALPSCGGELRWLPSMSQLQRILFTLIGKEPQATLLHFGGISECAGRSGSIALDDTGFSAATLMMVPGIGFSVRRDNDPAARLMRGNREIWLSRPSHDLTTRFGGRAFELRKFVAGYTKYQVERPGPGAALRIVPVEQSHRVLGKRTCDDVLSSLDADELGLAYRPRCRTAPQTLTVWGAPVASVPVFLRSGGALMRWWFAAVRPRLPLLGAAALAVVVSVFGLRAYLRRQDRGDREAAARRHGLARPIEAQSALEFAARIAFMAIAAAILLGYVGWKLAANADAAVPMMPWPALATWSVAALAVATARGGRLLDGLIVTAWTVLVAVGHVALVNLTLVSGELRTLRFADDTTATIALMAAIVIVASQFGPHWIAERVRSLTVPAGARAMAPGLKACLALIVAFLAAWFAFGSEVGIAGVLQPSEAIKTLTIVLLAATVTTALERDRGPEGTLAEFWKSLAVIVAMFIVILVVPISRNDLSPFLILVFMAAVTFLIVVIVHWSAVWSERLLLSNPHRSPPPNTRRRRGRVGTVLGRFRRQLAARAKLGLKRLVRRPEPAMIGLFLITVLSVWYAGASALADARETRKWLMTHVGEPMLNKPVERFISWLEFNGRPDAEGVLDVEFADVGLQVNRSRGAIAASGCHAWHDAVAHTGSAAPAWNPPAVFEYASAATANWLATRFLSTCERYDVPDSVATYIASRMPAIQNDFVSTWVIVSFGRDGATGVVLVQCLLVTLMLLAGFLTIKWSPGHLYDRPAAALAGFATIGFAVTLGLQWTISWHNALGLLPVMGQPATFLSHGPSHTVLFGTPAVLSAVLALRMRSAFTVPKAPSRVQRLSWWHIYTGRQ